MRTHNLCCHGERRTKYTYFPVSYLSFDETKSIPAVVTLFFVEMHFQLLAQKSMWLSKENLPSIIFPETF